MSQLKNEDVAGWLRESKIYANDKIQEVAKLFDKQLANQRASLEGCIFV